MRKDESLKDEMSGSTAITMLYRKSKLFVGNVGDSRCIACINGLAEPLSSDHKPCNEEEKSRIGNVQLFLKLLFILSARWRFFGEFVYFWTFPGKKIRDIIFW